MARKPDSDFWNYFNVIEEEGVAECKLCMRRLKNRTYNLKLHIKKVHEIKPEIERYFKINVLENTASCRTCQHQLVNRLCNIKIHMRKVHNTEIKLPENNPVKHSPAPQPYNEDKIQAAITVAKRKMVEEFFSISGKRSAHRLFICMDKKTVIRSVIGLIVEDGISPHLFNSEHFDAILGPICESISEKYCQEFKINEAKIGQMLNIIANSIRNDFSNELSCRLLTIKIDNDLGGLQSVFCVSAMFVDDGEMQNRVLGLIELEQNTKLEEDNITQILHKFNIDSNQIISVFWDHTKSKYTNQVENSEYLNEIEKFIAYPEIYLGEVQIEPYLSSSAQLCLLNTLKNEQILQPFMKCRNLVKLINDKINPYFELFVAKKISLPQLDSPWNPGSTCRMMNDLLEARSFLQSVKSEKSQEAIDPFNSNEDLWSFVEAFCKSTNYLHKLILQYHNQELHIGEFYAQWLKCKLLTKKFAEASINSNDWFSTILTELLKSIEDITNKLLTNECVAACLYLDPRFQCVLNASQKETAVEYLQKLWCRSKLYAIDETVVEDDQNTVIPEDEDIFLNEFISHDLRDRDKAINDIFHKIRGLSFTVHKADTNILSFWEGLKTSDPELYNLSKICFAIPATEVYAKTRYSHIYPFNDTQEMSAFTKDNLLYLRLNAHLLDNYATQLQLIDDDESNYSTNSSDNEEESCEAPEGIAVK